MCHLVLVFSIMWNMRVIVLQIMWLHFNGTFCVLDQKAEILPFSHILFNFNFLRTLRTSLMSLLQHNLSEIRNVPGLFFALNGSFAYIYFFFPSPIWSLPYECILTWFMSLELLGSRIKHSFPGGSAVRICLQCRSCRRHRFNPWVGKMPWRRACMEYWLQYSCLENPMDREA